jgi:hypothetical protein
MPPDSGCDGGSDMARHKYRVLAAVTLVMVFGFGSEAFADTGAWDAVVALPLARVLLGVASVAFTAALARGSAR